MSDPVLTTADASVADSRSVMQGTHSSRYRQLGCNAAACSAEDVEQSMHAQAQATQALPLPEKLAASLTIRVSIQRSTRKRSSPSDGCTATTTVVLGPVKVHHLCTGSERPTLHAPHPIAAVHKQDLWQQTYQVDSSGSVDGATELATELAMALAPAVTEGSSRQQQSPHMHFDFCCSVYVLCACCHQIKPLSGMNITL